MRHPDYFLTDRLAKSWLSALSKYHVDSVNTASYQLIVQVTSIINIKSNTKIYMHLEVCPQDIIRK